MASKYTYPRKYLRWYLEDGKLALVTTDVIDSALVVNNIFSTIDESLIDGLLVEYNGSVPHLDIASKTIHKQEPDVGSRVHSALIHYILSRLYSDRPNKNEADIISANSHYTIWRRRIAIANGGKARYFGSKVPIPDKRTSLRN